MIGGIREYARYRGVSHTAVRKAIASDRIKIGTDGTIDFGAADTAWKRNTPVQFHAAAINQAKPAAKKPPRSKPVEVVPAVPTAESVLGESMIDARTRRERAEADIAELKARKAAGDVIEAAQARKSFAAMGRIYTAAREGLPKQLAPKLIGLTDLAEIERILRTELRAADTRIADEIESRHGDVLFPEGSTDGSGLGTL